MSGVRFIGPSYLTKTHVGKYRDGEKYTQTWKEEHVHFQLDKNFLGYSYKVDKHIRILDLLSVNSGSMVDKHKFLEGKDEIVNEALEKSIPFFRRNKITRC